MMLNETRNYVNIMQCTTYLSIKLTEMSINFKRKTREQIKLVKV